MKSILYFLAGFLIAIGLSGRAQPYIGVGMGFGTSRDTASYAPEVNARAYLNDWTKPSARAFQAFAGLRKNGTAAEIGVISLPNYRAYSEAMDPPRATEHEISARTVYARGNFYWERGAFEPYTFIGAAKTRARSREWGMREGSATEYECTPAGASLMYGIGAQWKGFRAEFVQIPRAYASHWTGRRSYSAVLVSAVKVF